MNVVLPDPAIPIQTMATGGFAPEDADAAEAIAGRVVEGWVLRGAVVKMRFPAPLTSRYETDRDVFCSVIFSDVRLNAIVE